MNSLSSGNTISSVFPLNTTIAEDFGFALTTNTRLLICLCRSVLAFNSQEFEMVGPSILKPSEPAYLLRVRAVSGDNFTMTTYS